MPDQGEAHRRARSDEPASRQRPTCVAKDLHEEVSRHIEQEIALLAPNTPLERQKQIATVCTQIVKALLSLMGTHATRVVGDLKVVMSRYVEALADMHKGEHREE